MVSHVVSGLVSKRAEIAGRIVSLKNEISQLQANLLALDNAIKVFDPDFEIQGIKARAPRTRNQYFEHGELQRLVLDTLRKTTTALTNQEIAERLMEQKNIEATAANIKLVQKTMSNTVSRLEKQKRVKRSLGRDELRWKLA
ncbi:hypothetical protein [Burkholderia gladioli]|uniref:hypothetical protein n=1 Tax=Burkholderia gladioli TaxID=28095 RepID=UPI00163FB0B1|nr:hypothetical protein [Burkholderia gladioli]